MLIRNFMKDVKNHGFKYVVAICLMYLNEICPWKWVDMIMHLMFFILRLGKLNMKKKRVCHAL